MTGLGKMIESWRHWRRVESDVNTLPVAELDGMGLSRADLRDIAHMSEDQIARMGRAAAVFGVPEGALDQDQAARVDVARTCAHCAANGQCRREMSDPAGTTAPRMAFCPNAGTYLGLARR